MNSVKKLYPQLTVNFNSSYLSRVERICSDYTQLVQSNAKYAFKTRKEYTEEQRRLVQVDLARKQSEASERFRTYQGNLNYQIDFYCQTKTVFENLKLVNLTVLQRAHARRNGSRLREKNRCSMRSSSRWRLI
jgi:hypothetical protein